MDAEVKKYMEKGPWRISKDAKNLKKEYFNNFNLYSKFLLRSYN